jgi:outer membrane protein TolC
MLRLSGVIVSAACIGLGPGLFAPAQQIAPATPSNAPPTFTLRDAIARAQVNSPEYHLVLTEAGVAHEDKVIARAALLPSVVYRTQYLYTQPVPGSFSQAPGGPVVSGSSPRFIANNAVHEYVAQGNVHEELSLAAFGDYARTGALEAAARARAEIAARGLLLTIVQRFYGLAAAQRKYATAQSALNEAERFLRVSTQLENGGEVAHSDVIKAQIQANDRKRDVQEAQLTLERTRLDLAVLLFKDFDQSFSIADDLGTPEPLPTRDQVATLAQRQNPDVAAAFLGARAAERELGIARFGYLPSLSMDYFYGIDATHFAVRTDGLRNLGYAAQVSLNLPVWDWFATHARVRQATLQRDQARLELTTAQKKLLADLQLKYAEAATSSSELETLRQSAELAAESLRVTTLRYQAGESTVLEVVDAQNTLTQARNNLDDGEVRYRVGLADLQTLTGTLNP